MYNCNCNGLKCDNFILFVQTTIKYRFLDAQLIHSNENQRIKIIHPSPRVCKANFTAKIILKKLLKLTLLRGNTKTYSTLLFMLNVTISSYSTLIRSTINSSSLENISLDFAKFAKSKTETKCAIKNLKMSHI